ncbi:MAG: putative zinc-binding protein, partial [Cytophagaceae bacterium]
KPAVQFAVAVVSGAGQIAYKLALVLNENGIAEMSCLAGLASGGKTFLHKIKNRKVWIIDGCSIECSKRILHNNKINAEKHISLAKIGIKKNTDPQSADINRLLSLISNNKNTEDGLSE